MRSRRRGSGQWGIILSARVARAIQIARATPRRRWLVAFTLIFVVLGVWGLTTPPYGGPDEPYHVIRAVALAHGDLTGSTRHREPGENRYFVVPSAYVTAAMGVPSFIFYPDTTPAAFQFPDQKPGQKAVIRDGVGRYPPAYYAVVSPTALVSSPRQSVYLMRLITIAISAALLASAALTLERVRDRRLAAVGLLFALTPTFLSLTATVNPNGPEIAAAIALWVSGILLVKEAPTRVDARLVARVGAAATVLTLTRQVSPFWLALIGLALAFLGGRTVLAALAKSRAARVWALIVVSCTLAQSLWVVIVKPLDAAAQSFAVAGDRIDIARAAFGQGWVHLVNMIGTLGYSVDRVPNGVIFLWIAGLGALVLAAVTTLRRRTSGVLLAVLTATFVLPVVFEALQAAKVGLYWSGRYTLPLAVGVPILAGLGLAGDESSASPSRTRLTRALFVMVIAAGVFAYAQQLRRYTVGSDGPLDFWRRWAYSPPLPPWLLLGTYVVVLPLVAWWWWSLPADGAGSDPDLEDHEIEAVHAT